MGSILSSGLEEKVQPPGSSNAGNGEAARPGVPPTGAAAAFGTEKKQSSSSSSSTMTTTKKWVPHNPKFYEIVGASAGEPGEQVFGGIYLDEKKKAMAMACPAGQCALLVPSSPLLSLREPDVCLPSYAVSFSGSHTPLPTHRFARFITSAREDGGTSESETERKGDSLHFPKANLIMMHSQLICCKIYISESRNPSAIAKIDQAAWSKPDEVVVLSKFGDYFYNRVRYTLISYIPEQDSSPAGENPMKTVVSKMIDAAIANIDLNQHTGAHPRMGVVDDLSFHPLGDTKMEDAAELAKRVATYIAGKKVPVFLYGEAHKDKKELGKVRRELGYYNQVSPGIQVTIKSDFGPSCPPQPTDGDFLKSGATTVGVSPFLEGYNVPVRCENDADRTKLKDIAKGLRAQLGGGGDNQGLPKVLAIALPHGNGIVEVACLLDPNHVSANDVQDKVKEIATEKELGDKVEKGYYTDITKDMIPVTLAMN